MTVADIHNAERKQELLNLVSSSQETHPTKLAALLGISRQRYHQLEKVHPEVKSYRLRLRASLYDESYEARLLKKHDALRKYAGMGRHEFFSDPLREAQHYKLYVRKNNSKGLEFDLNWGDLEWPALCPVLGIPIDYYSESGKRNENSCSFDRLDNTQGYVKGNVRVISWRANRIKNDGTAEEHRKIAAYIDKLA